MDLDDPRVPGALGKPDFLLGAAFQISVFFGRHEPLYLPLAAAPG
jgi:hypothetical protein